MIKNCSLLLLASNVNHPVIVEKYACNRDQKQINHIKTSVLSRINVDTSMVRFKHHKK